MPDRLIAPPIKDAIDFDIKLPACSHIQLRNGVPLYYINSGAEEVAMVELVFMAGNAYEKKNGIAATTNYLLKNGTSQKNAFALTESFEYYGAFLNRNCYNETASITLHCLSRHLRELLPVMRELITDAVFPDIELDIFKQNSIQRLTVNLQKCDFVANRFIDQYVYGADHPYGRVSREEDIQQTSRQDLVNFYRDFYLNGKCMIFSAGKLPTDFEAMIDQNFGDLHINQRVPVVIHKPEPAKEKKYRMVNDENGVQSAIRIARPFPNRHHPDFSKAIVLNTLFGGYFGSRLMTNIREEKGYTYGISSHLQNHLEHSAWVVSTEAGKEVTDATVAEVYHEMQLLRDKQVDDEELLLVKNYLMGQNLGYLDGPFAVIARWKGLILNELDDKYFYQTLQTIKTITAAELQQLAQQYMQPSDYYELVVI